MELVDQIFAARGAEPSWPERGWIRELLDYTIRQAGQPESETNNPLGDRPARLVLVPGAAAALQRDSSWLFVCFIGQLRHGLSDAARQELWACDQRLCGGLMLSAVSVLSYASCAISRDPEADWFNLVLYQDPAFIKHFAGSSLHNQAVAALSPRCFSRVCVRRGRLHGVQIELDKSIMLQYDAQDPAKRREVFDWPTARL